MLFYKDDQWYTVCGDNFTDNSAAAVCKELGFKDGHAQCCDLYGQLTEYPFLDTHQVIKHLIKMDEGGCIHLC